MFGLVLTSIVTAMHLYVFWRVGSVPWVKKHTSLKSRFLIFLALWGIFFAGRMYGHGGTGSLAASLEFVGMNWMAMLFLMAVSLIVVDIVTAFGLLMKRIAPRLRAAAILVGLMLSVIALFQGMRPPVVQKYDVYLSGLPEEMEGKVIVGISDLHLGSLIGAGWFKDVQERVQSLRPDMIMLLGDIFEGHETPGEELLSLFRGLSAPMGVWAVPGNHDGHGGGDSFLRNMDDNGIKVLRNTWAEPSPGFYLAGVDDYRSYYHPDNRKSPVEGLLREKPSGSATVLLSHAPRDFEIAASYGIGLMLSGHTHGGQLWPFDYLSRTSYPLIEGKHVVGGMTMIISRGTGTWGPRMRLWSPGEILHITLHRASDD